MSEAGPNSETTFADATQPAGPEVGAGEPGSPLVQRARGLASEHAAVDRQAGRRPLTDYLKGLRDRLADANRYFRSASEQELAISYAAEWLLDNYYVAQQALTQINTDLPAHYYRELPKLAGGELQGLPRVYALARDLIRFDQAQLDPERVTEFVSAYQEVTPLTIGELWALPVMLRLGIIQCLALAAGRLTHQGLGPDAAAGLEIDLAPEVSDDQVVANSFMSLRALSAEDWKDFFENLNLSERILRRDPAGIYSGMDFDTRDSYRKVVEEIALHSGQDEQAVAREAVRLAQQALDHRYPDPVARPIGEISGWDGMRMPRQAHVGFYLLATGRAELEKCMGAAPGYAPPPSKRLAKWIRSRNTAVFLGGIALLAVLFLAGLAAYAASAGGTPLQVAAVILLGLVPALTVAVGILNWLITAAVRPRVLPKMDFKAGLPPECSTLVAIPALITNSEEAHSLFQQLELHYLRNADPALLFALVTDFRDADQAELPGDTDLIEQAKAEMERLNRKYGTEQHHPFFFFHRRRVWNPGESKWMGWERKRGKLFALNQFILQRRPGAGGDGGHIVPVYEEAITADFSVCAGDLNRLAGVRYVITLDADTILPRDSATRLIATLAHPLNRAVFASDLPRQGPCRERVVAGYTILQPRTEISPTSANLSLFTRIFAGDTGLDLYTLAVSDVYQDFFGEGIYVGKGIYDLEAFERSLAGCVPENALLSHDLFEGIHGRAALVSDVILIEDYPPNYLVQISRVHRWARGDWQLLPWLLPRVPAAPRGGERTLEGEAHPNGRKGAQSAAATERSPITTMIPNHLPAIHRWKILDNLRRSLVAPAVLLLFVAGWLWLPGSPLMWTLAGLITLGVPLLTGLIANLFRLLRGQSLAGAGRSLRDETARWFLALAFLPYEAQVNLDAILTTLGRLWIVHRNMLLWTPAAQAARRFANGIPNRVAWNRMAVALFFGAVLAVLLAALAPQALPVAAPLLVIWILSPEIAYRISQPIRREPAPLSAEQEQELRSLARRTWLFFEQYVGPDDHWLPPDHFQESPLGTVAHRTSPTNIGLYLLTTLAAYDMGYIGLLDLSARLQSTFESLAGLERYRGHFLNWFDTRTLEPLPPRYVSTVDSGNLAACLIALDQGCLRLGEQPVLRWESWQGLLDTLLPLEALFAHLQKSELHSQAAALLAVLEQFRAAVLAEQGNPPAWAPLLERLNGELWVELDQHLVALLEAGGVNLAPADLRRLRLFIQRLRHRLDAERREIEMLLPWLAMFQNPPEAFLELAFQGPAAGVATGDLQQAWQELHQALPAQVALQDVREVAGQGKAQLEALQQAIERSNLPDGQRQAACDWCARLAEQLDSAGMAARVLQIGFEQLARQAETYAREMDFGFLFDPERQVFHIGYNLALGRLDNNYYDLLASEARIASLWAIAKGDVPQSHWLHLARPLTQVDGTRALLSWSATMFEYLMPPLLLRSYEGTLLHQSEQAAAAHQMAYGARKNVPWGISESGYYRFDANQVYQYRAFGAPGLGYKRGLSEDLVITPYASLLALPLLPQAVLKNIRDLERYGMLGTFGLYEAIDFTPARLPLGKRYGLVQEYMAHHQGMIFLSLSNYLGGNAMVERFHSYPRIQTVELLLQEQVPEHAPLEAPHSEEARAIRPAQPRVITSPWRVRVQTPQPRVHFLSNGRYGVMITSSGAGYSTWHGADLTRWRADTTLNNWGTWIYVQDQENGELWSAGHLPVAAVPSGRDVFFSAHMVEFRRRDRDISLNMEVTVAPEDDVEIRRVTLTNHTNRRRRLRLVSYGEVVLAAQNGDARHPAFNKLFIESEWLPEENLLLFRRRPRSAEEEPVFLGHSVLVEASQPAQVEFEGDRLRFLGRGGSARRPQALLPAARLSGAVGATLDPIFALGQEVELEAHASLQVVYLTLAASARQALITLAERYRAWQLIDRAFDGARSQAELELRQLGLNTPQVEQAQRLLSLMLYPHPAQRAAPAILGENRKGQPALWAYSISGDYPILLVRVQNPDDLGLVHELLLAHAYWRNRQLKIDLVFLNEQGTDYGQELNGQIHRLIARHNSDAWLYRRGGIFLLLADQMSPADRVLLESAARAILDSERGSLAEQLASLDQLPTRLPPFLVNPMDLPAEGADPPLERPAGLQFFNGYGGFSPDGREYVVYLEPGQWTPAPWTNVIANPEFGFIVTDSGGGCTWAANSGENRLTTWSNDPVQDTPGEALYLRDEETGEFWSPLPLPRREEAPYLVRHGAGYSTFEHRSHDLKQTTRLFAVVDEPVKVVHLRLENRRTRVRRITVTFYAEWVLGSSRENSQQYVVLDYDGERQTLLARNPYNPEFGERVAFAAASKGLHGLTANRAEFLGRMGSMQEPAALGRVGLSGAVESGMDPCAALQLHVDLQPGAVEEVYFLLGQGADQEHALSLVGRFQERQAVDAAWDAVDDFWDRILGKVQVSTPDPAMDLLLNRWLLYQALACRIWGRSAFYQSSGAYGFRDQLQDVTALIHAAPQAAREHLLRAARHQFEAGDVLHWWHPPSGRGVRTRFSDDLLWLPFVCAYYVLATGDESVLDELEPFQKGPPLEPGEDERYGQYETSSERYSLYEHCRRAIEWGTTAGLHGLPLMGSGDWNDGMNRVGIGGQGESVWLGWFLYTTLLQFAEVCARRQDDRQAEAYRRRAEELRQALEKNGWDGAWYLRAFYDDGTPLGSAQNRECQIDALAQSWAVLSGAGEAARVQQAMESVSERLVRPEDRLVLLFTPPFDKTPRDPGYIKGYLPGIRENGGQYTHAALWTIWAFADLGQGDRAGELFRLINPVYHSDAPEKAQRYRVEPYVVAADVYSVPPHTGRGGWTWYTGSSGWMYRLGVEAILGLRLVGGELTVDPCIPQDWPEFSLEYRQGRTVYSIRVENPNGVNRGVVEMWLDDVPLPSRRLPLPGDGRRHTVRVVLGHPLT